MRKTHQDDVRVKIKVTELINRVQAYALGELEDGDVSSNRLNAIKMLLAKALPDLTSVNVDMNAGDDDVNKVIVEFVKPKDNG